MTTEALTKYVGEAIEEHLIENGQSVAFLARRLEGDQFQTYRWLKGTYSTTRLNEERVQQIAEVLRVDDATRMHWLQLVKEFDGPLPRPSLRRAQ